MTPQKGKFFPENPLKYAKYNPKNAFFSKKFSEIHGKNALLAEYTPMALASLPSFLAVCNYHPFLGLFYLRPGESEKSSNSPDNPD